MLKSVLAAMPTYAMTCFKLLQSLCKRIQSALTRFWWGSSPEKQKISWVAWKKMADPKCRGGLGFKDINNFNDALLAKLSWRLLKSPNSLPSRILLGKYCCDSPFLVYTVSAVASHGWRSLIIGRDLLIKQLGCAIGDGISINLWNDLWLSPHRKVQPMGPEAQQHLTVSDLINTQSSSWNIEKIDQIFPSYKQVILSLKPSMLGAKDKRIWLKNPSGEYFTKSCYLVAAEEQQDR